ncbi:MAG TPA: non-ribosomal peptide synthetase [Ktedonobacteraceae bacterium]|nr:non-ribosomal peptide synthetase [Ktedonobacteraceae bacterium]
MKTAFQPLLHEALHQAAEKQADKIAIEWRREHVSYTQLEAASNQIAHCLHSAGIAKGTIVAVVIDNPIELITSLIGILKAGCAFAVLDPNYPEKRLQLMIEEAPPGCFLLEKKFAEKLRGMVAHDANLPFFLSDNKLSDNEHDSENLPEQTVLLKKHISTHTPLETSVPLEPDDLCYIYFTSGSTGKPKAIAGRLGGLSHFIAWERTTFQVNETFRVSQLIPPSFDPFLRDIFVPLCSGATLCVPDNRETTLNPRQLMQWIEDRRINLIHCVPTVFRALVNEQPDPAYFKSLKYLLIAGEPLFGADVKKWMDIYGEQVQLVNLYGPTETTLAKFFYFIKSADKDRLLIPVGKPIDGASALVLNDERTECPPGIAGEIYIQTPYRTLGYYNRPELTSEVFIQNPFNTDPDDIIYKTGDIGRVLEDGNFEVSGRKDHQVKIRGVRIELGEIEKVLRDHPIIKDAVVKDWDNANNEKYLCAYFVSEAGLSSDELRAFLLRSLPPAMIPAIFIRLEKLPLNPNGKIDRKALPAPDESSMLRSEEYVAPRTPTEKQLAAIWADLLGLQQVGVTENFFALGAHSLLIMRFLSRIQDRFPVELSLNSIFETPTVQELSILIEQLLIAKIESMSDTEVERLLAH